MQSDIDLLITITDGLQASILEIFESTPEDNLPLRDHTRSMLNTTETLLALALDLRNKSRLLPGDFSEVDEPNPNAHEEGS
jgi:hypothetical protein